MKSDTALAFAAGAGVSVVTALAGFVWLRRALRAGQLGPQALLQATALRLVLSLAGALGLTLGWRAQAAPALAGLAGTYLVLLLVETRWATTRTGGAALPHGAAPSRERGEEE